MAQDQIPRKDTDGVTHYVDQQDEPMSCALACIGMVWQQFFQKTSISQGKEAGYKKVSGRFDGSLLESQLKGENLGLGTGTTDLNAAKTLEAVGITVSHAERFFQPDGSYKFRWEKSRIASGKPCLISLGWYSGGLKPQDRKGGHFIVGARCTRRNAVVVLDPARGTLHELHGANGVYLNHSKFGKIESIAYTG